MTFSSQIGSVKKGYRKQLWNAILSIGDLILGKSTFL
jgi:hypothetical protein